MSYSHLSKTITMTDKLGSILKMQNLICNTYKSNIYILKINSSYQKFNI